MKLISQEQGPVVRGMRGRGTPAPGGLCWRSRRAKRLGCCKESGARELVSLRPALGRAAGSALTAFGGSGRWQRGGMTSFRLIGLFAAGISNVPYDPGEHKQRGRPRQQGSDHHRCYRCHDSSLMRSRIRSAIPDPGGSSSVAGLSLLGDRRLRTFVEPSPIGLVALPLTFVGLAAPGRAKLLEVQAEADQPERALAIRIPATICHDAASALVRRIPRMNCS